MILCDCSTFSNSVIHSCVARKARGGDMGILYTASQFLFNKFKTTLKVEIYKIALMQFFIFP